MRVATPNSVLDRRPFTSARLTLCIRDFFISGLYHAFMKTDWRTSIKAYPRNKSLKVTLANKREDRCAVILTPHPGP